MTGPDGEAEPVVPVEAPDVPVVPSNPSEPDREDGEIIDRWIHGWVHVCSSGTHTAPCVHPEILAEHS